MENLSRETIMNMYYDSEYRNERLESYIHKLESYLEIYEDHYGPLRIKGSDVNQQ